MGFIELLEFDFENKVDHGPLGAASTTNTSVTEENKQNPIGFIWKEENAS